MEHDDVESRPRGHRCICTITSHSSTSLLCTSHLHRTRPRTIVAMSQILRCSLYLPARPSAPRVPPAVLARSIQPPAMLTQRAVPPPPLEYTLNPATLSDNMSIPVELLQSGAGLPTTPALSLPVSRPPPLVLSPTHADHPLSVDSLQQLVTQQSLLIQHQAALLHDLTVSYNTQLSHLGQVNESLLVIVKAMTVSHASGSRAGGETNAAKRRRVNSAGARAGTESAH